MRKLRTFTTVGAVLAALLALVLAAQLPPMSRLVVVLGMIVVFLIVLCIRVWPARFAPIRSAAELDAAGVSDPRDRLELEDSRLKLQNDVRTTLLATGTGLAVIAGLAFTWLQFQNDRDQQRADRQQFQQQLQVTRQGQIADRFTRAVEQMASQKLEVKLGGIYGLERIAKTSNDTDDRLTVFEVLSAYLRNRVPVPLPNRPIRSNGRVMTEPSKREQQPVEYRAPDAYAAIRVLGRRVVGKDDPPLDLSAIDLTGATLDYANLSNAELGSSTLRGVFLGRAILRNANFGYADLRGADFIYADLEEARFEKADLRGSFLGYTNMKNADLTGANLTGAFLNDIDLRSTKLEGAILKGALINKGTVFPPGFDWKQAGAKMV